MIVSLLWIALLNVAFGILFAEFSVRFNPAITHEEAYHFGQTWGVALLVLSVVAVVYLAVTNNLPGARRPTTKTMHNSNQIALQSPIYEARPNPSIERTVSSGLRPLPTAAHVKR